MAGDWIAWGKGLPEKPEITLQTHDAAPEESTREVLEYLEEKGLMPAV